MNKHSCLLLDYIKLLQSHTFSSFIPQTTEKKLENFIISRIENKNVNSNNKMLRDVQLSIFA